MHSRFLATIDRQRLSQLAASLWSAGSAVQHVQDSESFVFRMSLDGQEVYLRITNAERRSKALIEAELDWIEYLAANGVTVARPLPSAAGAVVEMLDENGQRYHASVFPTAPGVPLTPEAVADDAHAVQNWGRLMGKMHAETTLYRSDRQHRHRWDEDDVWCNALTYLPASDDAARTEWQRLNEWMSASPTDQGRFGLIHGDLCVANFRVSGNVPTAFDFDDCCYHWNVYDMVCAIAPQIVRPRDERRLIRTRFAGGYLQEFKLDDGWEELFDQFLRVRALYLYVLNHRDWTGNMVDHPKRGFLDFLRNTFRSPLHW